jgi:hypothetical protein
MGKSLFLLLLLPAIVSAQSSPPQVAGRWMVSTDFYGAPLDFSFELKQEGDKVTGNFQGAALEGSVSGNSLHFLAKDDQGGTEECLAHADR